MYVMLPVNMKDWRLRYYYMPDRHHINDYNVVHFSAACGGDTSTMITPEVLKILWDYSVSRGYAPRSIGWCRELLRGQEEEGDLMQTTVSKERLLSTLRENRDAHREAFEKAQGVYREQVIALLDARLQRAREGGKIDMIIRLPEPQDYTDEYDTVIEMVEWAEGETITLEQREFQQYVRDEWGWMAAWQGTTGTYLAD